VPWRAARVREWLAAQPLLDAPEAELLARTRALARLGFGGFDALHLASAELGNATAFVTVDDRCSARRGVTSRLCAWRCASPSVS
jgi:hypothetical protein